MSYRREPVLASASKYQINNENHDRRFEGAYHPAHIPYSHSKDTKSPYSKIGNKYVYCKESDSQQSNDYNSQVESSVTQFPSRPPLQMNNLPPGPRMERSPSFRNPQHLQNTISSTSSDQSYNSHYTNSTHPLPSPPSSHPSYTPSPAPSSVPQAQAQQVAYLKDKLYQNHHKLMRELQLTNKLSFELETLGLELDAEIKENDGLRQQLQDRDQHVSRLEEQVRNLEGLMLKKVDRSEEKYRMLEGKMAEESRKNGQLKEDLQAMRNKMLQTMMAKNTYQQQTITLKAQLQSLQKCLQSLQTHKKQSSQKVDYLTKQLQALRKKHQKQYHQLQTRSQQIHQYNHLASQRQKIIVGLQAQLKIEKQKNINSIAEIGNLQAQYKAVLRKIAEIQDHCDGLKGQIFLFQKNRESTDKDWKERVEKITEEYNFLNLKYKDKEREIENIRKKSAGDPEKKRRNYDHTKQFVQKLEYQQHNLNQPRHHRPTSRSPAPRRSPHPRSNQSNSNPITHQAIPISLPLTHNHPHPHNSQQQKRRYIDMISQVEQLESQLHALNLERSRMLGEIDKIDGTKVKTKDMIARRRRLQDEVHVHENMCKSIKEEIRKAKPL